MRQYVIDSLNIKDISSIKEVLQKKYGSPFMNEVFIVEIEKDLLNDEQKSHTDCSPHYFSLLLEETSLVAEMLVRSKKRMRCSCMGYADSRQVLWLINLIDIILDEAGVSI